MPYWLACVHLCVKKCTFLSKKQPVLSSWSQNAKFSKEVLIRSWILVIRHPALLHVEQIAQNTGSVRFFGQRAAQVLIGKAGEVFGGVTIKHRVPHALSARIVGSPAPSEIKDIVSGASPHLLHPFVHLLTGEVPQRHPLPIAVHCETKGKHKTWLRKKVRIWEKSIKKYSSEQFFKMQANAGLFDFMPNWKRQLWGSDCVRKGEVTSLSRNRQTPHSSETLKMTQFFAKFIFTFKWRNKTQIFFIHFFDNRLFQSLISWFQIHNLSVTLRTSERSMSTILKNWGLIKNEDTIVTAQNVRTLRFGTK